MPDSKKIRHNNIKKEHQKSFLMVAATGWASPLDPRQCALCGRCAVSTTLTPQCLSSMVCTKSLCQSLFDMLTKKVSNRQRWYGIPKDVSEIERSLNKFLKNDSDRSLGPLLTDWYNNNTIGGDNHRLLIDTVNSFLTFSDSLGQILWIHRDCAEFSPDIRRDERETWYNVLEAVRNASDVKCVRCSYQGATIVCSDLSCKSRLHRHCAIEIRAKSWRDYAELKDSDEGVPVPPPSLNSSYFCWKHRASFSFYTVERNRNAIPLKFVGHEVEKDFGTQGKFVGIVWHYDPCAKYFNVVYEDGDSEEISLTDLIPILVEDRLSLRLKRSEDLWNALKVRLLGTSTTPSKMLQPVIACFENAKFPIEGDLYRILRQSMKDLSRYVEGDEDREKMKVYENLRKIMRARLKWWSKIASHLDDLRGQIEMVKGSEGLGEHGKLLTVLKPLWSYRSRLMGEFQRELQSVMNGVFV